MMENLFLMAFIAIGPSAIILLYSLLSWRGCVEHSSQRYIAKGRCRLVCIVTIALVIATMLLAPFGLSAGDWLLTTIFSVNVASATAFSLYVLWLLHRDDGDDLFNTTTKKIKTGFKSFVSSLTPRPATMTAT